MLRRRGYWRIAAVGQLAALPIGMTPLAYTLLTAAALGSYRVGSVLVTVAVLGQVAAAPVAGRVLDRLGVGRGLPALPLVGRRRSFVRGVVVSGAGRRGEVHRAQAGGEFGGGFPDAGRQADVVGLVGPALERGAEDGDTDLREQRRLGFGAASVP